MLFFSKSSMAVESGINSSCVHSCLAKGKRPGPSECGSPLFLSESQDLLEILCTACCRVYFNHISKSQIGSSGTHMSSVLTSPLWHNFDQICFFSDVAINDEVAALSFLHVCQTQRSKAFGNVKIPWEVAERLPTICYCLVIV